MGPKLGSKSRLFAGLVIDAGKAGDYRIGAFIDFTASSRVCCYKDH